MIIIKTYIISVQIYHNVIFYLYLVKILLKTNLLNK